MRRTTIEGVELVVFERIDLRNQHGALEYIVEAWRNGELKRHERIEQSKWLGHCHGQLLLPQIAKRANDEPDAS